MKAPFRVGTATVEAGTTGSGDIEEGQDLFGRRHHIPVTIVNGAYDGPRLWIVGGIHGDEFEGAISAYKLLSLLDPQVLRGAVVINTALYVAALNAGRRFDPLDLYGQDMNKIYPGKPNGFGAERIAWAHWSAMKDNCDLLITVHSGGGHSFFAPTVSCPDTPASVELAAAMGPDFQAMMKMAVGTGTPEKQLASSGKPACLVEVGGKCRTLTDDFHRMGDILCNAYVNVLRHYGMIPGDPKYADRWHIGHQVSVLAGCDGVWVGNPGVPFVTTMEKGFEFGRIYDLYGNVQEVLTAPQDGMVFGLRSEPIVHVGEWVVFYLAIDEERDDLVQTKP